MNNKKICKVEFDHSLSHIMDGFVCQVIAATTGIREVRRSIGRPDELLYYGDDAMEMHIQDMIDRHMEQLTAKLQDMVLEHITANRLALKNLEETIERVRLMPDGTQYDKKVIPIPPSNHRLLPSFRQMDEDAAAVAG